MQYQRDVAAGCAPEHTHLTDPADTRFSIPGAVLLHTPTASQGGAPGGPASRLRARDASGHAMVASLAHSTLDAAAALGFARMGLDAMGGATLGTHIPAPAEGQVMLEGGDVPFAHLAVRRGHAAAAAAAMAEQGRHHKLRTP